MVRLAVADWVLDYVLVPEHQKMPEWRWAWGLVTLLP
jgi:hypothetical protein